ncbi:hypothetical protein HDV57DRAFT_478893 [Trichoderma longibrachiatum]|uniref:Uncharacterized protein n=1 Tax=Trichoderma longibrachiatum ATCC 18648 TaxID=983965 RepID=A0A2T4CJZ8_TRILO|nr:hypothetical protein M440DRAFT_95319 [Trichoderma longibrachiatum ATCC 18648]
MHDARLSQTPASSLVVVAPSIYFASPCPSLAMPFAARCVPGSPCLESRGNAGRCKSVKTLNPGTLFFSSTRLFLPHGSAKPPEAPSRYDRIDWNKSDSFSPAYHVAAFNPMAMTIFAPNIQRMDTALNTIRQVILARNPTDFPLSNFGANMPLSLCLLLVDTTRPLLFHSSLSLVSA